MAGSTTLVTTAPESYDGFGTVTLSRLPYRLTKGIGKGPCRVVKIEDSALDWQRQRYASGMYLRLTPDEFNSWVSAGEVEADVAASMPTDEQQADDNRRAAVAFAEAANQVLVELREQFVDGEPSQGLRAAAAAVVASVIQVSDYLGDIGEDLTDRVDLSEWEGWI